MQTANIQLDSCSNVDEDPLKIKKINQNQIAWKSNEKLNKEKRNQIIFFYYRHVPLIVPIGEFSFELQAEQTYNCLESCSAVDLHTKNYQLQRRPIDFEAATKRRSNRLPHLQEKKISKRFDFASKIEFVFLFFSVLN